MIGAVLTFIFMPFFLWFMYKHTNFFDSFDVLFSRSGKQASASMADKTPVSAPLVSPDAAASAQTEMSKMLAEITVLRCRLKDSIKNHNTDETIRISGEIDALRARLAISRLT